MNLLDNGKEFLDTEWADFAAEMLAEGHSFFIYHSDSVDSLSSCCRLRNEITDNQFSYTLGAGGISTGSKCVMTININRLVQDACKSVNEDDRQYVFGEYKMKLIETVIADQVSRVHKYLKAFNTIVKDRQAAHLLPLYDAGFVSPERQYLTVGINGLVEAAEFLGCKISADDDNYREFVNLILKTISDLNKVDREEGIMFNTEYVPSLISGHNKPSLIDLKLSTLRQQGASVKAA